MADRLAENGAVQYGQESTATAGTTSRLAGAGQIEDEIRRLVAEGFYTAKVAAYTVKGRLINAALNAIPPVIPFSPLSLFSSGEPGAWYDPTDINLAWRRNLVQYSQEFNNAYWQKAATGVSAPVVTANQESAPDGTFTADKIAFSATTATSQQGMIWRQVAPTTIGQTYTASVYLRTLTGTGTVYLGVTEGGVPPNPGAMLACNLTTSWQRFQVSWTTTSANNIFFELGPDTRTGFTPAQPAVQPAIDVYAWGAQLELNSTATSYQVITDGGAQDYQVETLGSELVTNGDFSNGTTGWTDTSTGTGTASVINGQAVLTGVDVSNRGRLGGNSFSTVVGRFYKISWNIISGTAASQVTVSGGGTAFDRFGASSAGSYSGIFMALSTTSTLGFNVYGNGTVIFDNFSVKEVISLGSAVMFQDAAGTTPVSAVEQPVGLILDKRAGSASIKPELVTNNTFDTDTVWTKGTGWTISGGEASASVASSSLSQTIALTAGKTYRIVYTITRTAGTIAVRFTGGTTLTGTSRSLSGTYVDFLTALTGNTTFNLVAGSFTGTVDNVYVKEVTGYDACQPTSAARPTLKALYNLLTYTEQFDNAAWAVSEVSVSADATTAPDGTTTADKLIPSTNNTTHSLNRTSTVISGIIYTLSIYVKKAEYSKVGIREGLTSGNYATFNLTTGLVISTSGYTASIEEAENGFYRISVSSSIAGTSYGIRIIPLPDSYVSGTPAINYTGDGTSGLYIWGADFRVANDGVGLPSYQRVAASTDYDTTGFPPYLSFDGTDDHLLAQPVNLDTITSDGLTRRNLLTFPTMFAETAWNKNGITVTSNTVTNPFGTLTADVINDGVANSAHNFYQSLTVTSGAVYTISVYAKKVDIDYLLLGTTGMGTGYTYFNLADGTIGTTLAQHTPTITSVGNGWYRCSITGTTTSTTLASFIAVSTTDNVNTYTGANNNTYVWGAQVEAGSTATTFQNIGTDEALIVAGQRKLKESTSGPLFFSALTGTSPIVGSFALFAPGVSSNTSYRFSNRGSLTAVNADTGVTYVAPHTGVVSGIGSISGDLARIRVNGSTIATTTTDQGTGNYAAASAFLIGRNGTGGASYFQGRLYNLVVRCAASTDTQISDTETYVNNLTKAY